MTLRGVSRFLSSAVRRLCLTPKRYSVAAVCDRRQNGRAHRVVSAVIDRRYRARSGGRAREPSCRRCPAYRAAPDFPSRRWLMSLRPLRGPMNSSSGFRVRRSEFQIPKAHSRSFARFAVRNLRLSYYTPAESCFPNTIFRHRGHGGRRRPQRQAQSSVTSTQVSVHSVSQLRCYGCGSTAL